MRELPYSNEHKQFRERLRSFLEQEVTPNADQWEADHIVPKSAWKRMGDEGFLCTAVADQYGGPGLDFLYSVIGIEEMARTRQMGLFNQLHSDVVVPYIESFGSEEVKKKYLPGCVSGDVITAVAMTEPGAGSDLASLETTAVEEGESVVINGSKTFISNGLVSDLVIVAAKDPAVENKHAALSLYLVEGDTPGFERGKQMEKMGMRSQDTTELFFNNCRIPVSHRLGEKGSGFVMLMQKLQQERLVNAISNVYFMEHFFEIAVDHCKQTTFNGKPLSKSQAVKFALAEMLTEIKLNRAFVNDLILAHMEGADVTVETMMSKYASSETANRMVDQMLDLFGEFGALESSPLARGFRDLRIVTIFAGTTEVMKTIIAQSLGL